jgi:ABC-type lipoprotein export system ATPase subunit
MRFYVVPYRHALPPNAKFPCVQLTRDSWNDFGYVTLFTMTYHATKKKTVKVGSVKILRRGESSPRLDSPFGAVPVDCCSLGQSLDYYKTLSTIREDRRTAILRGLRDVVNAPALLPLFESDGGWKTSVLRFSEAELALKKGRAALDAKEVQEQPILFTFQAVLKGASAPFVSTFRFGDTPTVPSRIMALVGKNGAGKTWFLSRLAAAVSGEDPEDSTFAEQRPPFSRAIAVSYSALDRFRRPGKGRTDRTFSYQYCGIYDETGRIAPRAQMFRKMRTAFETVRKSGHEDIWSEVLADVLDDGAFTLVSEYLRGGDEPKPRAPALSSGQLVLASTLTGVIAVIEPASLLLYDEPELHLHPNAIAGLMRAIERLLSHFRSYAVIATHSPMILQQVPAQYVRVFTRLDRMTTIEPLGIESFGQNLTVLTEQIFKAGDTPSRFRDWSQRVAPGRTMEEIQAGFEYPLSFEAKMFLRADRGDV